MGLILDEIRARLSSQHSENPCLFILPATVPVCPRSASATPLSPCNNQRLHHRCSERRRPVTSSPDVTPRRKAEASPVSDPVLSFPTTPAVSRFYTRKIHQERIPHALQLVFLATRPLNMEAAF